VSVPDELADAPASVASCAGATVMAAKEVLQKNIGDLHNQRILVTGVGMLGLIAVETAIRCGAKVVAVEQVSTRRNLAADLGAKVYKSFSEVSEESLKFDGALEFSGVGHGVETCIEQLEVGGCAVLVGSVSPGPRVAFNPEDIVRGWKTLTGVHNYEPIHLSQAVDFLSESLIPWDEVISAPISLDDVPKEFNESVNPIESQVMRTLVKFA
jgi:putative phosphonate catabolism associated alcohol dehydrogenase